MSSSSGRDYTSGRHATADARYKQSPKLLQKDFTNNLTRRNNELTELHPRQKISTSLLSANIKALRLFRHACRLLPFILNIHEIKHRVTPVQSKRYVANWFRRYSKQTDLTTIDEYINYGYNTVYEAQMQYSNSGYLYKFILPPSHHARDQGINRFYDRSANRISSQPQTKFLQSFYRGPKSHNL